MKRQSSLNVETPQQSPPHQQWFTERSQLYQAMQPGELKAFDELADITLRASNNIDRQREAISAELNEYERHVTGYFTLAISFIVGGLLSNQLINIGGVETRAARVLFVLTIAIALVCGLLLFTEYIITFRLFNRWQKKLEEISAFINGHAWEGPDDLDNWIREKQKTIRQKSTHVIQACEMALLSIAFLSLILWLIEKLFNPDWPFLN
jgi:hypothetical protein